MKTLNKWYILTIRKYIIIKTFVDETNKNIDRDIVQTYFRIDNNDM